MKQEEKLSINWLNYRAPYDNAARSIELFNRVPQLLPGSRTPVIADLGAGTGNNLIYMIGNLNRSATLIVVEQHEFLMDECKRRICSLYRTSNTHPDSITVHSGRLQFTVEFVNASISEWISRNSSTDLYIANALFDLLTKAELTEIIHHLDKTGTNLYSSLNYTGIEFEPESANDLEFVKLFEKNMSRQLDRGRPLGVDTLGEIGRQVEYCDQLNLTTSSSNWEVLPAEQDFLIMNFDFYRAGIKNQLNTQSGSIQFENWWKNKIELIKTEKLKLVVNHSDILITHKNTLN